jgi:type I site-specific restriction endonuclease
MSEKIRKIVDTEKDAIIIGSSAIMSTGINIKSLTNIIFAINGKSSIRLLQSVGRSLRLHEDKEKAKIFDIVDDLSVGKHRNFTLQHFLERVKIYDQEQFEYKIKNIDFKL